MRLSLDTLAGCLSLPGATQPRQKGLGKSSRQVGGGVVCFGKVHGRYLLSTSDL